MPMSHQSDASRPGRSCAWQVRQAEGLPHSGRWYCFDDVSVDPWDIANLEQDCFGGHAAARSGEFYTSPLQVSCAGCRLGVSTRSQAGMK